MGTVMPMQGVSMEKDEIAEKRDNRLRAILRLAGLTALATAGLIAVAVGICWLAGWRSASQISSGLMWAGVAAIAAGVLSTMGGWGLTRDSQYMYAQSVSQQPMTARTRQTVRDSLGSYKFAIIASATGILCVAVGALI